MSAKKINKLLVTGSTGLVGSRFVDLLKDKYSITTLGRANVNILADLTSQEAVIKAVSLSDADAVMNFAAFTNVDKAETEKGNISGEVYTINTLLPLWLAKGCRATGKKLYHISTDYVFDGKKQDQPYKEEDTPDPVNSWYCITKYKGELEIADVFLNEADYSVVRVSYPYSGLYEKKLDIARAVVKRLSAGEHYIGINNQKIKPTSVDDITKALDVLLQHKASGIFHVAGNFSPKLYTSPLEFAQKIAECLELDASLIKPMVFSEFSKTRIAPRPQHTWLDTSKIEKLGFRATYIDHSLKRFKEQLLRN